jgi:hypothetical protein
MLELFDDVKARYGRIVPLAHRDFQRVKPRPGRSELIKTAFHWMGGHGKDYSEARYMSTGTFTGDQICDVDDGTKLFDWPGGPDIGVVTMPLTRDYLGGRTVNGDSYALISSVLDGKPRTVWVPSAHVKNIRGQTTGSKDCTAAVAVERERIATAVLAAIKG